MFDPNGMTEKELYEKQEKLTDRLSIMSRNHQYGTSIYTQCFNWLRAVEQEISDRIQMEDLGALEPGTVAIIGEKIEEPETDGEKTKRKKLRFKGGEE